MTEEERALVWLCACTDTEYRERVALLRAAKNPVELLKHWEKFSDILIKFGKNGLYKREPCAREREADDVCKRLTEDTFAVTLLSDDYPVALKNISDPPLVLFGAGNRALLKTRKFCIVGSRSTPPWAEKAGKRVSEELSEYFTIVTGLAEGGDGAAVAGALASGNLICVLPTGLDLCYPAAHASLKEKVRRRGLLLSEYPFGETAKKYTFHARNRILAGLSEGVLVLSAGERSGTLITANAALDYGREVFALPHNLGVSKGEGCNALIKKGAYLTTGAEDILEVFGIEPVPKASVELTDEEARILNVLREGGNLHVSEIAERAEVKIFEAAATLSSLEIKNLAVKSGGNHYSAV